MERAQSGVRTLSGISKREGPRMRKAGACLGRAHTGVPLVRALVGTARAGAGHSLARALRPLGDHMSESASGPVIISSATLSVRLRIAASNRSQTSGFSLR